MPDKKRVKAEPDEDDDRPAKKKGDPLGKLIEEYSPSKVLLLMTALVAPVLGAIAGVAGLIALEKDLWLWVLVGAGGLASVGLVCLALLKFGRSNTRFAIHKKGVRFQTRKYEQYLLWEEIESIDIRRVTRVSGASRHAKVKYEVLLVGSETIHLENWFLGALDDPNGLIKALKRHSGKDFETAFG